jgi:hypothetical protein
MPFPIQIDATSLSMPSFQIAGVTGWLETKTPQSVQLEPGAYRFMQSNRAVVPEARFQVREDGTVDYRASSGDLLSGRGTSTLKILGLPIILDASRLDAESFRLLNITPWLSCKAKYTLRLLPGAYQFYKSDNTHATEADFSVNRQGQVQYADASEGILTGRGSNKLAVIGLPIILDVSRLDAESFRLLNITPWLSCKAKYTQRLLPGVYQFNQSDGKHIPEADFTVTRAGLIDYPASSNGLLAGLGSGTLRVLGYALGIDGTAFAGTALTLPSLGISVYTSTGSVQTLHLLPQKNLRLNLQTTPPREAQFDLNPNGSINLGDDYPFVVLDSLDGRPLLRFIQDEIRQKRPCRRPSIYPYRQ